MNYHSYGILGYQNSRALVLHCDILITYVNMYHLSLYFMIIVFVATQVLKLI